MPEQLGVFFFFLGTVQSFSQFFRHCPEQITILGTAKETSRQRTKDNEETKDRTKTGAPTSARSGGLNTKAKGLPPDPAPPHAAPSAHSSLDQANHTYCSLLAVRSKWGSFFFQTD